MKPVHQQVLMLRRALLGYKEIAEATGLAKGTISWVLRTNMEKEEQDSIEKLLRQKRKQAVLERQKQRKQLRDLEKAAKPSRKKGTVAPAPFEGFLVFEPRLNSEGRAIIVLYSPSSRYKTSMSYARYQMSVYLGRRLSKDEEVDHKDGDPTNDAFSNLQILTPEENAEKRLRERNITRRMVRLICPNCSETFVLLWRDSYLAKKGIFTSCGKPCRNAFLSKMNSGLDVSKELALMFVEEFRENSFLRP